MPVSWTLDDASGIVRIEYALPYTFEDWRSASEQLRADPRVAFQRGVGFMTNRANLGAPAAVAGASNFGTITTALDPRVVQLAVKVLF